MKVHLDMETSDPDDVFSLCLLATHPKSTLTGVTVFPGGRDQIGVVKHILDLLGKTNVRVGADVVDDGKARVSGFHYRWLGKILPADPNLSATQCIDYSVNEGAVLVTGAALRNIHKAYNFINDKFFTNWTCQGGFAGDNVVPKENRLKKFDGKVVCPTYNLNGDPKAALELLESERVPLVRMVSKNICHGIIFGPNEASRLTRGIHFGLDLLLDGMNCYFQRKKEGKALHDVVAASLALNHFSANWCFGMPYRLNGNWGFQQKENYKIKRCITIGINVEKMYESWMI